MEDLTGLFVVIGIIWFIIALIVGSFGKHRTIGFAGAFYASLLLSPILGMLFVLASDKKTDTGLSSGEKVALYLPLGLIIGILIIGGTITAIENAKWEKEYAIRKAKEAQENALRMKREKEIADSLSKIRYAYWQKNAIPSSKPITKPKEIIPTKPNARIDKISWNMIYQEDKSVFFYGIGGSVTIPENQIGEFVTQFKNADKLINYCKENSVPELERKIGSVGNYNIILNYQRDSEIEVELHFNYKTNEIMSGYIYDFNCNEIIKFLTTKRNNYYKQLNEYNAYQQKKEQEVNKFASTLN